MKEQKEENNMKRRELTTTVVKLNWKYIIDHATDRKFLEQKFKVYDIDGFEVFMEIYEIDISYKKIYFELSYKNSRVNYGWETKLFAIPMSKEHFNEKIFNNTLCTTILSLINESEDNRIRTYKEYSKAETAYDEAEKILTGIAKDFLDKNEVKSDSVREAYTEAYVNDNIVDYRSEVLDKYRYRIFTKLYLECATYFDYYQEKIDEYKEIMESEKRINFAREYKDIENKLEEVKSERFEDYMKDKLEKL
jgi:hypothetical protein